jgi:hypothetical protein
LYRSRLTLISVSESIIRHPPEWYANLYKKHNLTGGHVIMLGPGNEVACAEVLRAWPGEFIHVNIYLLTIIL